MGDQMTSPDSTPATGSAGSYTAPAVDPAADAAGGGAAADAAAGTDGGDLHPSFDNAHLQAAAKRHLWMHFTRMSSYETNDVPVIVRGEGPWVWDSRGKRYLDGLSGLFVVQAGHGRRELAEAASRQAETLAFFPLWSYAHPNAIELSERLANLAPGDLNRIFFTTGGGEAVETAWKLARQYFRATGEPGRYKVLSRNIAYHGTTMGALSITGLPDIKAPFEPLVPGSVRVANTNFYRAPEHGDDLEAFGQWAANDIEARIEMEGPDTVAAVFLEPVQNSGGCFPPPPGYFQRVREICDRHGVLLVSDEVICAFGRLGSWFGSEHFGYQPDMITCAKGLTSGYSPLGAVLVSDRLMEPFLTGQASFSHGFTFGGHPVSTAVALANLDLFEKEDLVGNANRRASDFRAVLDGLRDLPIVGDVRGEGYFYGIELVKDRATRETFDDAESERLLRGFLSPALFEAGLVCRADDRGDPVIQLAPPLICEQEHFELIGEILRSVLTEAWTHL
jgi:adenosylmethionine-8-amino-7-oxononanoate aminotransferase